MKKICLFALLFTFSVSAFSSENYKIYEDSELRADGAKRYYILIPTVDLSDKAFKMQVKSVLSAVAVKLKTKKFSAKIFDDKNTLGYYLATLNNSKAIHPLGERSLETHWLAWYEGEDPDTSSPYNVSFFPYADVDNEIIGDYFGSEDFEP